MALDPAEPRADPVEGERGEHEGHAEPYRVRQEEQRAVDHALAGGGHGEDGAEHVADARRPADGEGGAGDEGAGAAGALRRHLEHRLRQLEHPGDEESAHGDEGAGGDGELLPVADEEAADAARAGPHQHEHDGEPRHEEERGPEQATVLPPKVLDADAGDEREVDRQERQNAGRDERQKPRREGESDRGQAEGSDLDRGHERTMSAVSCRAEGLTAPSPAPPRTAPAWRRRRADPPPGPARRGRSSSAPR